MVYLCEFTTGKTGWGVDGEGGGEGGGGGGGETSILME